MCLSAPRTELIPPLGCSFRDLDDWGRDGGPYPPRRWALGGGRSGGPWLSVGVMDDKEILGHIDDLIATEHDLRARLAAGEVSSEDERQRLASVEESLDQCWDLLRQRRARREFGEDPEQARVRPAAEVEGYQQ